MAFIASGDIYAFPVGTRGSDYPLARLTTEQNLVNIVKSVTDMTTRQGFVITASGDVTEKMVGTNTDSFEFVLGGYYFRTEFGKLPQSQNALSTLYACMTLARSGDSVATYNQEVMPLTSTNSSNQVSNTGDVVTDVNQVSFEGMDDTNFNGIEFIWADSVPSGYTYTLPVLFWDDNANKYRIKEEYRYKLDSKSIDNEWIDLTI